MEYSKPSQKSYGYPWTHECCSASQIMHTLHDLSQGHLDSLRDSLIEAVSVIYFASNSCLFSVSHPTILCLFGN